MASTSPSQCSPSTSISAPQGFARSWVSTCAPRSSTAPHANLERTDRTQPALFTVEYALAKLIETYGVRPAAMAGHSIGEYVAATIAGVFDLPTAVKAVSMRARLMHAAPRGVMVAVPLSPDAIAEYLSADVDLATVNDPGGCVVAGIRREHPRSSPSASPKRGSRPAGSARRMRSTHG